MKVRLDLNGEDYLLTLNREQSAVQYRIEGSLERAGEILIERAAPGLFSIIEGSQSHTVRISQGRDELEVWIGGRRLVISLSDPRDRVSARRGVSLAGPQEVRSLMPGKVVKLLVQTGDKVEAGQGLAVVEAMKMQNEMKSPKAGRVARIHVKAGATVGPGEPLIVIE